MTAANPSAASLAVLARIRAGRPMPPPGERCEMCAEPIASAEHSHSHVVNVGSRVLLCTCRACYLLFTAENAALAYQAIPDRYLAFPSFAVTSAQWDDLAIPVGIAFFFHNTPLGRTVAFYPSPAGATESELPLGAWDEIVAANPAVDTLVPDVEALLIRVADGGYECFLVPIDACYALVGHLRSGWRGFDGGSDVRRKLTEFFAEVRGRSRPAPVGVV